MERAAILVPPETQSLFGGFSLDLERRQSFSGTVSTSRYPREDGTQNTDHAFNNADVMTFEGLLTDTPVGTGEAQAGRAEFLYGVLNAIKRAAQPIDIESVLFSGRAIILSLEASQDETTGYSIPITLQIEEVQVARERTTELTSADFVDPDSGVAPSGDPGEDEGRKQGTEKERSVLHQLFF